MNWQELSSLPDSHGFAGPIVGVADDAVVVAGGTNFTEGRPWEGATKTWHDRIFVLRDPAGQWQVLSQRLPRPLAHAVSVITPEGVLIIGGCDADRHYRDVFLLRLKGEQVSFEEFPPLPEPLALASGALLANTVYIAGGILEPTTTETSKSFYSLDLKAPANKRAWVKEETWPGPGRMLAAAAAQDGSFYLFSGVDLDPGPTGAAVRTYLTDAYRFTPKQGWKQIHDLPRPANAVASPAPAMGKSLVLLMGGDTGELAPRVAELKDNHPGFSREILAYDTVADTWSKFGELPRDLGPDPAKQPNEGLWPPAVTGAVWWKDRLVVPSGEVRPGVRTPRVLVGLQTKRAEKD